ncbi:hypothetical protein HPB49_021436 [Dermacentor silvarum]|uniref:Uncharacterized protein n=1 Tax=Dermacentor silvarum TaxID=543639 RepID=A0ACB8CMU6_DERSI|nr:hypothetical protein HPB49_021436 [Dermacentor silvarum]
MATFGTSSQRRQERCGVERVDASVLLLSRLKNARSRSRGVVIDHLMPCTAAEHQTCHIAGQLATCNELLFPARLELRDLSSDHGQLCLASFAEPELHLPDPVEFQLHQAATLVYWLLKTHRCVGSLDLTTSTLANRWELLLAALESNSSLRTLKIDVSEFVVQNELFVAIASLKHLEELECSSFTECLQELPATLSLFLRNTRSLTVLKIPGLRMKDEGARKLMTALKSNVSIRELSLHGSIVCQAGRRAFAEYLKATGTLTTLTIVAEMGKSRGCFTRIIEGLIANRTVSNVELKYVPIDPECIQLTAKMFLENPVLRIFNVSFSHDTSIRSWCNCWLLAVANNDTLQELRLPFHICTAEQWTAFLRAVSRKRSLKKVTIDVRMWFYHHLEGICAALRESSGEEKVSFGTYYVSDNFNLIEYKTFSDVEVSLYSNVAHELLLRLPACGHITCIRLHICTGHVALSSAVADYVRETMTLEKLQLYMYSGEDRDDVDRSWTLIVLSLSQNTSIRELQFEMDTRDDVIEEQHVESLAQVILSMKKIRKVHFEAYQGAITSAFIHRLSMNIAETYTLQNVTLLGRIDWRAATDWLAVRKAVCRNISLVARAIHFASGRRRDGYCARALELVWRRPVLLEEFAEQEHRSVSEATAIVQGALKWMESMHDFMRLTGVVKERVVCHECEDNRTQLDNLNEHCWYRLRRYLTLDDVKDITHLVPLNA